MIDGCANARAGSGGFQNVPAVLGQLQNDRSCCGSGEREVNRKLGRSVQLDLDGLADHGVLLHDGLVGGLLEADGVDERGGGDTADSGNCRVILRQLLGDALGGSS